MKKIILTLSIFSSVLVGYAQTVINDQNAKLDFKIKNMGVTVEGNFKNIAGTIIFNPSDLTKSKIDATLQATTINTGIAARDNHLRKAEFFDVKKFGTISFKSTKITLKSANLYTVVGVITIKGVSKNVAFEMTATPKGKTHDLTAKFNIDRRNYGIGGKSLTMSDLVTLNLSASGI
jgi:polyisoprenoid-binding protein YceI